jgi:pyruvate,water dikinase
MLTVDELEDHLAHGRDARALVLRRRAEMAWVSANPGPPHYGPAPSAPPSLRGLPEAARRLNEGLLFMMMEELSKPGESSGDGIRGIAASSGVYRGKVRVITDVHELHRLKPGEVLVCPSTTAAWMMVFNKAGALVTDHGSVLTHTSIVAREHQLPAVVATQRATTLLSDGDEVIVDGTNGTVTRVDGAA